MKQCSKPDLKYLSANASEIQKTVGITAKIVDFKPDRNSNFKAGKESAQDL